MKQFLILILLFAAVKSKAQTTLYTKDTLADNPVFRQRIKSATIIAANNIAADSSQPYYEINYAQLIITDPEGAWLLSMIYQVVANPAISYGSTDSDIQFTVNSNFDKVAKAYYRVPLTN